MLQRLHEAGVRVRQGQVLLACDATADHIALDAVESLGLEVALVRNRGALMLIPAGVTKGTGLREALAEVGISPHNVVAVGDAENDHTMLAAAGLGVAVANAVEALRRVADLVLTMPDGAGVADRGHHDDHHDSGLERVEAAEVGVDVLGVGVAN